MPDQPAKRFLGFSWGSQEKYQERLATPEELAEYGAIAPDPATEAKILALFEEQLVQDLVKRNGAPPSTGETTGAAVVEISAEEPAVEEPPEAEVHNQPETETSAAANETELLAEPNAEAVQEAMALLDEPVAEPAAEESREVEVQETAEVEPSEPEIAEVDLVPESHATSNFLLEYAEILDQHRMWVETNGETGARGEFSGANLSDADLTGVNLQGAQLQKANLRGADLSMANLRNTNLVEADLREANLLGTEFSGANLMGTNLYGAQGLWAGRLGGTNLFDATLPEAVAALNGSRTIAEFTRAARWFYLMLMVVAVGACALIALTSDVRLLLDESAIRVARIPNILPLQGFYLGAPLLITVLYLRLQFLLLRLWGSMGALPAVFPDGQTPEKDGRWYLMGPIRPHLRWSRDPRSPLGLVECYVAMGLAYWAVPATLFFFWLRYLVMQDYRGTLLHVFLFALASAGACGMPRIVKRVLRPGDWTDETTSQFTHDVLQSTRIPVLLGAVLFLFSIGVIRGLPSDNAVRSDVGRGDPRRWASTAFEALGFRPYADLTDERVASGYEKAGAAEASNSEPNGPRLNEINLRYARGYHANFASARLWRANLEGSSLVEGDFRGANLREASLKSARLDGVRADKANLVSADGRWATFSGGSFQNADMSYANLEGATLATTNLTRATLYAVNLRGANLLRADLSRADLRDTKLEGANLSLSTLEQTDLSAAKMIGVNLTGVQAKGTIFLEGDLSKADLRGGTFTGAILRQVKLDGANLMGTDLRGALGLEAWQVCSAQGWQGAQLDADVKMAVEQACGTAAPATAPPPSH
ncbi:MAG TPA: pentapeptide repeat-containing protein [Candidatus Saccharimonadales bacterium]|nr:pentapeptide repeat-containing protein [Candidatus Saccharimonadales bacterium]